MRKRVICGVVGVASILVLLAETPSSQAQQAPVAPAGQQPDQPTPAVGRGRGRGAQIPARIVRFTAEPETIGPGQSTTLRWAAENPGAMNINHGIGTVTPRGLREVSPSSTTTYTLTVNSPTGPLTKSVTVTVPGTIPAPENADEDPAALLTKQTPRTPDGHPDLSGVYNFGPPAGGRGGARGGGGRGGAGAGGPQLKAGAESFRVVRGPLDTGASSDCMPIPPPGAFGVPYPFQIVQTSSLVIIFHEYPNTFRIIPTDGRKHLPDPDPKWMGDPIGRWEGDAFIVDSVGFNDKTEINGFRHTEGLHVIERFRRPNYGTLEYEVTVEDPAVFAAPWQIPARQFGLRPELTKIDEFVCENNRDYRPLFGKTETK